MNINQFKQGDVITRNKRSKNGDGSWLRERMTLVGFTEDLIFLVLPDGEPYTLDNDGWEDGWIFYPQSLWDKTVAMAAEIKAKL